MKLETKSIDIQGSLGGTSLQAMLSQEDLHKMWDTLQNPYKNSIGSIVREIVSNGLDAHTEIGAEDAVVVRYGKDDSGLYISFIDLGVGMSSERIHEVYLQYLKSTKEETNELIGGYGRGSKSPLSYQEIYYINTIYDGIEHKMMMRKGELQPVLDILEINNTTERNGTEIKLYIKSEQDLIKFLQETFSQLHYFKNVVIDLTQLEKIYENYYSYNNSTVNTIKSWISKLNEDYKLIEGKHFILRTNTAFTHLHLSIGNVYYPIDYNNLDISSIGMSVALKFEIGELPVIQTREDIRYTDAAIITIKNKIESFKEELVELYDKQNVEEIQTIKEYIDKDFQRQYINFDLDGTTHSLLIPSYFNLKDKFTPYQLKGLDYKFISIEDNYNFQDKISHSFINVIKNDFIRNSFKVVKTFKTNGTIMNTDKLQSGKYDSEIRLSTGWIGSISRIFNDLDRLSKSNKKLFKSNKSEFATKKNKYIQEVLYKDTSPEYMFIMKVKDIHINKRDLYRWYKHSFKNTDKSVFYNFLKLLKQEVNEHLNNIIIDYDAITVDEQWWKDELKATKEDRENVEYDRSLMVIEKYQLDDYSNYTSASWDRKDYRINLEDFIKNHDLKIVLSVDEQAKYCTKNNDGYSSKLEKLIKTISYFAYKDLLGHRIQLFSTKQRNYDKILKHRKENSNIFTLNEFLNDKKMQTRYLGKIATITKIQQSYNEELIFHYGMGYSKLDTIITVMNDDLVQTYKEVGQLLKGNSTLSKEHMEELMHDFDALDLEIGIYDQDLLNKYNTMVEFVRESRINLYSDNYIDVINFILGYKPSKTQFRFAEEFYLPLTEDVICEKYSTLPNYSLQQIKVDLNFDSKTRNKTSYSGSYNCMNTKNNKTDLVTLLILKYELTKPSTILKVEDCKLEHIVEEVVEEIVDVIEEEELEVEEVTI